LYVYNENLPSYPNMFKLTYIRQNAHGNRSTCFYSFIEEEPIITCPYGHTRYLANNIRNGTYNLDRSSFIINLKNFIKNTFFEELLYQLPHNNF
jgi:hypothetical protein